MWEKNQPDTVEALSSLYFSGTGFSWLLSSMLTTALTGAKKFKKREDRNLYLSAISNHTGVLRGLPSVFHPFFI